MNYTKAQIALFLALLSQMGFANPPTPTGGPDLNCTVSLATVGGDFAGQVAKDAEARKQASAARVTKMTEQVLQKIRTNSNTVEGLDAAVEQLRTEFAIRPEDSKSGVLTESVGKLKEYGENTSRVLNDALELGRKVGAIKVMGAKDGMGTRILKSIPFVKGYVTNQQERNQTGQQAINNLNGVVDNQVTDIRRVDKLTKTDEMNWRKEYEELWNKADDLAGVREAVKATADNLEGLTPLQKRAYEQFTDELETAELIYRDLAESLQQQVLMNITVQKSLKETQKTLQTKTKSDLRKLAALLANIAAQDTALKGQDLAKKIDDGVTAAENDISKSLLESTKQMTALIKSLGDRTKTQAAREQRRQASQAWQTYDEEIRTVRADRNKELKAAYAKGVQEIQDHEIAAKTSAAVITDPAAPKPKVEEVKPATETAKPKPAI